MIRRISAFVGIVILLLLLVSLIWTVHRHRRNISDDGAGVTREAAVLRAA